jgi:hypothetical protein
LEPEEIARFFLRNAEKLKQTQASAQVGAVAEECAATLARLAEEVKAQSTPLRLEDLERHLTILEEKLLAALTVSAADADLLAIRTQADREIAPYRSKMPASQIDQLHKQFLHKMLFERMTIPRLSLFYM